MKKLASLAPQNHKDNISNHGKSAFTLIELLVVIAIIAILAAILFPVFARARENARRSSCQSNMKQIALGIIQYTQDYDEKFPGQDTGLTVTPVGWADVVQPYIKSLQLYQCPSGPDNSTSNPNEAGYVDYLINAKLGYDASGGTATAYRNGGINIASVQFPTLTLLNVDAGSTSFSTARYRSDGGGLAGNSTSQAGSPSASGTNGLVDSGAVNPKHLDGTVMSFVDGHVKWYKTDTGTVKGRIYMGGTPYTTSGESPTFRAQ